MILLHIRAYTVQAQNRHKNARKSVASNEALTQYQNRGYTQSVQSMQGENLRYGVREHGRGNSAVNVCLMAGI